MRTPLAEFAAHRHGAVSQISWPHVLNRPPPYAHWSTIIDQWSMIPDQWSMINDQWSTINDQRSTINGQRSTIKDQRSMINDQRSKIKDQQNRWVVTLDTWGKLRLKDKIFAPKWSFFYTFTIAVLGLGRFETEPETFLNRLATTNLQFSGVAVRSVRSIRLELLIFVYDFLAKF